MRRRLVMAAALAASLGAGGCGASGTADKAGSETTVLQFASIDPVNDNGQSYAPQAFIDGLAAVSQGRLTVKLLTHKYAENDPRAETALVRAIASGELDGGWPATRAFAAAGMTGLEAVEAPLTITSYAAEKELVSGPVAGKLLATLDHSGVVGLGLGVGPLRRPFAAKAPLLAPADWKGVRVRQLDSPVQAETLTALGAVPVLDGTGWVDRVRAGTLGAAEFDLAQYARNGLGTEAGQVTSDVVLWPKVFVLSLSRKRFDSLSDEQRGWVREAARRATAASVAATYDEDALVGPLCSRGVQFHRAGAARLDALRVAERPVLSRLAADPIDGPLLQQIQAIAARHPQPDVPVQPASCAGDSADQGVGTAPPTTSALPDGIYRVSISLGDVTARGLSNSEGITGTWTMRVQHGTYQLECRPTDEPGTDCGHSVTDAPLEAGDLRGTGHTVWFVGVPERVSALNGCRLPVSASDPRHCAPAPPYRATWDLSGDRLTFSDFRASCDSCDEFSVRPWQQIG